MHDDGQLSGGSPLPVLPSAAPRTSPSSRFAMCPTSTAPRSCMPHPHRDRPHRVGHRPLSAGVASTPSCPGGCARPGCWAGAPPFAGHGSPLSSGCLRWNGRCSPYTGGRGGQLVSAVFLAVTIAQVGFLGHDARASAGVPFRAPPQQPAGPAVREPSPARRSYLPYSQGDRS